MTTLEETLLANQKALATASNDMWDGRRKLHEIAMSGANPNEAQWLEQHERDMRVRDLIIESQALITEYLGQP